jgi:hypothetical protein
MKNVLNQTSQVTFEIETINKRLKLEMHPKSLMTDITSFF